MKIDIVSYTKEPIKTCAVAAWICTHETPKEIHDFTDDEASSLVKRVVNLGHESILEHSSFTVMIQGVSRAETHQKVRHRHFSYSQQSQRYVKFLIDNFYQTEDSTVWPMSISEGTEAQKAIFLNAIKTAHKSYSDLVESGVNPEDARYLLPNAQCSNIVMTGNARSWRHFFSDRMCDKAQWEIREVAIQIFTQLVQLAPSLFDGRFPNCGTKGECKTCKKGSK